MATVRLRVVALLLLLQYASVQVGGGQSTCSCVAPLPPTSPSDRNKLCQPSDCTPSSQPDPKDDIAACKKTCTSGVMIYKEHNPDPTVIKAVATQAEITCDAGKWKISGQEATQVFCVEPLLCNKFNKLTSVCPTGPSSTVNCETIKTDKDALTCPTGKQFYFKKETANAWTEATAIKCEQQGEWTATKKGGGTEAIKTRDEKVNVVCAATDPDAKEPCTQCTALAPLPSCLSPKCEDAQKATDSTTKQCLIRKCDNGRVLYLNNLNNAASTVDKITCDDNKKWTGIADTIVNADCRVSCVKNSKLKSDCPSVGNPKFKCDAISVFTDDAPLVCPASKHFFFKKKVGGKWTQASSIECGNAQGEWTAVLVSGQAETLKKDDEVICAAQSPDTIESCTKCATLATRLPCVTPICSATNQDPPTPLDGWTCLKSTCASTSDKLHINGLGTAASANEVTCTDGMEWKLIGTDEIVNTADCIKPCALPMSDCGAIADCVQVTNAANPSADCPMGKNIFYKDANNFWNAVSDFKCDAGQWKDGLTDLTVTNIICSPKHPDADKLCTTFDCPPELLNDVSVQCEKVQLTNNRMPLKACPTSSHKLYFKKGNKWAEAVFSSVQCNNIGWKLKYTYGGGNKKEREVTLTAADALICGAKNPDEDACSPMADFTFDGEGEYNKAVPVTQTRSVGSTFDCGDSSAGVFANAISEGVADASGNLVPVVGKRYAVCNLNGEWESIKKPEKEEEKNIIWEADGTILTGDKIQCRIKKCKSCKKPEKIQPFYTSLTQSIMPPDGDDCWYLRCSDSAKYAIKTGASYEYFIPNQSPKPDTVPFCSNGHWKYKKNDVVEDIDNEAVVCPEQALCHDWQAPKGCPSQAEGTSPVGCVDIELVPPSPKKKDDPLSCGPGKKIIIQKDTEEAEGIWDDVKSINCDVKKGLWNVVIDWGGVESAPEYRGKDNRLVCADSNPSPRPTTTPEPTTTTTLAPICALCKGKLPTKLSCGKCEGDFNTTAINDDECILEPKDKTKVLIVIQNFQVVAGNSLKCTRSDEKWKTKDGTEAKEFAAQVTDVKDLAFKPLSYAIIAATSLSIVGMCIGFPFIYMRCRRKPPAVNNKKPERGVTRKYSATTVVKTEQRESKTDGGGKGSGGKSSEPTPSKNENPEEAPTLKF